MDRALRLRVAGQPVFSAVQSTWNVLEPAAGQALARAHDAGVHVLVKETLANGRLVNDPPAPLAELAERYGVGPDAVAIAAVLRQPWADTVLCGPVSVEQLDSNLRALTLGETDRLDDLAESSVDYWSTRAGLAWD